MRGLIGFGANLLLAQGDPDRGRAALSALDFYAHADLFMTPTAALADIVLPIASCFAREALKIGFEIDADAQSFVQLRQAVVPPPGEARSDTDVVFALAARLGLGHQFWNGDIDAAHRHQLGPSGVSLEELRAAPAGRRVALAVRHAKHAEREARGFATPSRKVELWSETFRERGYSPLPEFAEPQIGPIARPDLIARFPLVLTCAKPALFCQSQQRALPSLRAAPGSRSCARHRRGKLGERRDAGRQHAGSRAPQPQARSPGGRRRARGGRNAATWAPRATPRSVRRAPNSTPRSMPRFAIR